jgi:hypothetical protein
MLQLLTGDRFYPEIYYENRSKFQLSAITATNAFAALLGLSAAPPLFNGARSTSQAARLSRASIWKGPHGRRAFPSAAIRRGLRAGA